MPGNQKLQNLQCNSPGQLPLFDLEQFATPTPDSEWIPAYNEPPDPDDYSSLKEYEKHWQLWCSLYPDLVESAIAMPPCESVGAQILQDTLPSDTNYSQVATTTKKTAPQHDTHWIERYWVERSGNKFWYYRYCWMVGRKKHRRYIGSVSSPTAKRKKHSIDEAIADGCTPQEIEKIIVSWRVKNNA